jgi:hypothetical protein
MTPSPLVQQRRAAEFEATRTRAEVDALHRRWAAEDGAANLAENALAQEVSALRRRVAQLERDLRGQDGMLVRAVGDVIGRVRSELRAEIKAVEAAMPKFAGVHVVGRTYEANSLVIRNGGLWISLTKTVLPPGSTDWCLCTKAGEVK